MHKDIHVHPIKFPSFPAKSRTFFTISLRMSPSHPCPSSSCKTRTHPWVQRSATPSCPHSNLVISPYHSTFLSPSRRWVLQGQWFYVCLLRSTYPYLYYPQRLTHSRGLNKHIEWRCFSSPLHKEFSDFQNLKNFKRHLLKCWSLICYIKFLYYNRYSSKEMVLWIYISEQSVGLYLFDV